MAIAVLGQDGTDDPTADVIKNTLATDYTSSEIVWTRNSAGSYTGTTSGDGAFVQGVVFCMVTIGGAFGDSLIANFAKVSDTEVSLITFDANGSSSDIASGGVKEVSVLIEVYIA